MAAVQRTPFAELSSGRLQQLASVKNRQNGFVIAQDVKSNLTSPQKRSFSLVDDSENVNPALSKKNKVETSSFKFELTPKPMSLKTTPEARDTFTPPRAPLSAPAGRSPKRKTIGLPPRRLGFTRIDPPKSSSISLPFSLDEALNNCLPKAKPVPSKWKFDIYVDTPEEEASTLMEHSTLTLDLSSDDESRKQEKEDCGKENVAPEGYTAPARPSRTSEGKPEIIRQKVADAMDDGLRSPLSDLEVEPFNTVPAGEVAYIVIPEDIEPLVEPAAEPASRSFTFTAPAPPARLTETKAEDIKVFEDEIETPVKQSTSAVETATV